MVEVFVVLAYVRHVGEPVEIGYASSYDEASRLVREWTRRPECLKDVSYFKDRGSVLCVRLGML